MDNNLAAQLLIEMINRDLPTNTPGKIFFCEIVGGNHNRYRLEAYRPDNFTQVYLREKQDDGEYSNPKRYTNHNFAWKQDGIERVLIEIDPITLGSNKFGTQEIDEDYFKSAEEVIRQI